MLIFQPTVNCRASEKQGELCFQQHYSLRELRSCYVSTYESGFLEGVHFGYTEKPWPSWALQLTKHCGNSDRSEQNSSKLWPTVCNSKGSLHVFRGSSVLKGSHILAKNYCVNVLQLRTNQNLKLINCMHQSLRILIFTKLFKKLPAFNGIQMFITIFTAAHHWSPSTASYILSTCYWLQHHFWHFRDYVLLNIEQYKLWSPSLCNFFQPLQPPRH